MTARSDPGLLRRLKSWIKKHRKQARTRLSTWLARRRGTPEPCGEPLGRAPETILICRLNQRLGNTLFVTPLIRSLAAAFPGAAIDCAVLLAEHRCLLTGLPNVREVFHVSRNPIGVLKALFRLRRSRYDLAIDPSINASRNRLCLGLCRARYKLGFSGSEQWLHLTHAVAAPRHEHHQARQAVYLFQKGLLGKEGTSSSEDLQVRPGETARAAAARALADTVGSSEQRPLIGFFTGATGHKALAPGWWRSWVGAIRNARLIQIVPPGVTEPLVAGIALLSFPELDRLAALMGLLDVFVSADCGPMHLAAAAGTPTIGLFRATDPADYAPLGRDCLALKLDPDTEPRSAENVAERTLEHLRKLATISEPVGK